MRKWLTTVPWRAATIEATLEEEWSCQPATARIPARGWTSLLNLGIEALNGTEPADQSVSIPRYLTARAQLGQTSSTSRSFAGETIWPHLSHPLRRCRLPPLSRTVTAFGHLKNEWTITLTGLIPLYSQQHVQLPNVGWGSPFQLLQSGHLWRDEGFVCELQRRTGVHHIYGYCRQAASIRFRAECPWNGPSWSGVVRILPL